MDENEEYKQAVRQFYKVYEPLRKKNNLRMHCHFSIFPNEDDFIEIWKYEGEKRKELICKATEEADIDCWRRATEQLESYIKGKESGAYARKAG